MPIETNLLHLPDMGCLYIEGPDAVRFLQGQLTCHVEEVPIHSSCSGAYCTPQGRIISLFYLFREEQACSLFMPSAMVTLTLNALKKFAVFFKVTLSDASHAYQIYGSWENKPLPAILTANQAIIRIPVSSTRSLFISNQINTQPVETTVMTALRTVWQLANIQEGLPAIYPETSGHFLPHDLNLDLLGAIHLNKGCYTGQEIIARMHFRGKIKNRLHRASTQHFMPKPGEEVIKIQGKDSFSAGEIVDTALIKQDTYQLLLVINGNEPNNTPLFLKRDDALSPIILHH